MRLFTSYLLYLFLCVAAQADSPSGGGLQAFNDAMSAARWHEALSDQRGGDQTELRSALTQLDKAIEALLGGGDSSRDLGSLEQARDSLNAQLEIEGRLLAGFSPLFPMLLGQDELLVRNGSHEAAAVRRAVSNLSPLIPGVALEKARTPAVVISVEGDSAAEMVAAWAVSEQAGLNVIGRVQLAEILELSAFNELRSSDPESALQRLYDALNKIGWNITGIHFLRIDPLESRGRVASAQIEYGSFDGVSYESVIARQGFAEAGAPGTAASLLIILLMFPTQYLLVRVARRIDTDLEASEPPPFWSGVSAAIVGYVVVWLGFQGLSGVFPGVTTPTMSLMGWQFLLAIAMAVAILPMFVVALGATRLPKLSGKLSNLDTLSVLLVGALLGAFARSAELTLARFGWDWVSAPLAAGALCLLVLGVTGALGFVRGLGRDKSWLAFGVVMLAGTGAAMLAGLRLELLTPIITAAVVMIAALAARYGVLAWERRSARARAQHQSAINADVASLGVLAQRLTSPPLVLPEGLDHELDRIRNAVMDDTRQRHPFQWIQITGLSGSGKTRLLHVLGERLAADVTHQTLVISGSCTGEEGGASIPYAPFREMLSEHLSVGRMAAASAAVRELQAGAAATTLKTAMRAAGLSPLAGLIDGAGDDYSTQVASDREIALSIARKISSLAADRHVVVLMDDLHHIDGGSLLAMRELITRLQIEQPAKLVFITSEAAGFEGSSEFKGLKGQLGEFGDSFRLPLDDLVPKAADEMVEGLLHGIGFDLISRQMISQELSARVIDHPADILRFIQLADETGLLEQSGHSVILKRNANLEIVPSPTDACSAVDSLTQGLSGKSIEILRCASLQGTRFRASILADIFGVDLLHFLGELDQASLKGIVVDIEDRDDYYEFADRRIAALFREDVRRSTRRRSGSGIPMPQAVREYRRRYVDSAAKSLLAKFRDPALASFEDISAIAGHARFLTDTDPAIAVRWTLLHGQLCLDRGMTSAAQDSLEFAWEAISQNPGSAIADKERLSVASTLIEVLLRNGYQGERLDELLHNAELILIQSTEVTAENVRIGWKLRGAEISYRRRLFEECGKYAEIVILNPAASVSEYMRARFLRAASLPLDEPSIRSESLSSVIEDIDNHFHRDEVTEARHSLLRIKAEALNTLGMSIIHGEKSPERASEIFRQALEINQGEEAPDDLGMRISLGGLGDSLLALGFFNEAEDAYRRNLSESLDHDDLAGVVRMSSAIGGLLLDKASRSRTDRERLFEEADLLYTRSLQYADRQKNPIGQAFALAGLARHRHLAGLAMDDIGLLVSSRVDLLKDHPVAFSILRGAFLRLSETIEEDSLAAKVLRHFLETEFAEA
jgi:tetratricopeptide (TPR) repeat protein/ABC-type nitrate/sulfonate/bicarbonate transport system ATPase subunit